ncbi:hypothetical protein [Nocardia sp. MW-W600-9]
MRTFQILTAPAETGFPYARQAIRVVRERVIVKTGETLREVVYAICSAPFEIAKPRQIVKWLRMHWGIENAVHHVRDVAYDEDRVRGQDRDHTAGHGDAAERGDESSPARRSDEHRPGVPEDRVRPASRHLSTQARSPQVTGGIARTLEP